jgi:hypothetical protein
VSLAEKYQVAVHVRPPHRKVLRARLAKDF